MSGIYLLDNPEILGAKAAGHKAANLGGLGSFGLPVPKGFCIIGDVYKEHIKQNNLESLIQSIAKNSQKDLSGRLSELRKAIIEASLPEPAKGEIEKHFKLLNCQSVAVRSSAAAEDLPGKSFAGQYETYLGIRDSVSCIEAVKKCWASLWLRRAFDYRRKNQIDSLQLDMAVIVQALIEADKSGVIFTADPITGRRETIVIEACFGLGEALVSGKVTPDRFLVDKKTKRLFFLTIAEKKIEYVPDKDGGVIEKPVSNELSIAHSLSLKQIKRLTKLAQKIETIFGCPQDIEWAIKDNRIWILQSRPITNLPEPKIKSREQRQVWTNANAGEAVPDVITPLTWSIIEALVDNLFRPVLNMICVKTGDNPIFGIIAGRVYFNINTIIGACKQFPNAFDLDTIFGGHHLNSLASEKLSIPPEDVPDLGANLAKTILRIPVTLTEMLTNGKGKQTKLLNLLVEKTKYLNSLYMNKLTPNQLLNELENCVQTIASLDLLCLFVAIGAIPTLAKVCKRWLNDKNSNIFNRLISGTEGLEDAQTGFDLWRIAKNAGQNQQLNELLLSENNWQQVREKLDILPGGTDFLKQWNNFMENSGHHCRGELELASPRWSETPDYVLGLIRSYILSGGTDLERKRTELLEQREQLIKECCVSLGFFKRTLFRHFIKKAQQGCLFRENSKNRIVSFFAGMRKLSLSLGNKLTEQGILLRPDDIFFLKYPELGPAVRHDKDFDVIKIVKQCRAEYEQNLKITPPSVVIGVFEPEKYIGEKIETSAATLTGIAVSPGIATGPTRVILRASDDYVRPGEILVAPFTDPGWTPYFVNAAGIVMDMGGLLSHGSIVAREYGIPCVVNVGPATKIIKTGQKITVDGNLARIQILQKI
ncbi:MAG: hypothetical protein JW787_00210 [Sedimentisphaerales bacterium]|nr:hypothetical protein [Sedimentisphaerales bacterium]